MCRQVSPRTSPRTISLFLLAIACLTAARSSAQSTSENADPIRGIVINSVTREPIARALVSSPDNRFAALTNSEGRFEFTLAKAASEGGPDSNRLGDGRMQAGGSSAYTLNMLIARKPGFLTEPSQPSNNLHDVASKDVTLALIPEAVIAGTVTLPTSEAPDSVTLQLFRRQVQDGRAHWVQAGGSRSMSDGQFRFANLPAGTYKLLTTELLDTDPISNDPLSNDPLSYDPRVAPFAPNARGALFGYPPVYYQNASDFESASTLQLSAGQTQTVNLSLVKQPYYRVRMPVIVPVIVPGADQPEYGIRVTVYAGHKGPGFSLGYNQLHHAVEGMLPNGTYTVEATSARPNGATLTGLQTITIKGAPIDGPSLALLSGGSIPVNVKEEFTSADHTGSLTLTRNGRSAVLNGPRRYLNLMLEPADDFGVRRQVSLRNPTGAGDEALVLEGAPAGSYWVRVYSSRGYPASIRSGNLDLQHQPLVVGVGGAASPIEITMRDDTAEISGTVEGVTPPARPPGSASGGTGQTWMHVYCIPLADSSGQFTEVRVPPEGSFSSAGLAPGAYRLLAFDRDQPELEYRNPEAMQVYDSKGPVVRVVGGQKERVTLRLISTSTSGNEP